jgi:hypothetical protein
MPTQIIHLVAGKEALKIRSCFFRQPQLAIQGLASKTKTT